MLTEGDFLTVLKRVAMFLNPGGVFVFDALTPAHLSAVSAASWVRESAYALCVHSVAADERPDALSHTIDLFVRARDGRYDRYTETHQEYLYPPETLRQMLLGAGFTRVETFAPLTREAPEADAARVGIVAYKGD